MFDKEDSPFVWFVFYSCDECGYGSLGELSLDGSGMDAVFDDYDRYDRRHGSSERSEQPEAYTVSAINWYADTRSADIEWYPVRPRGKEFEDVPQHIADAASEAYACFSIRSYRAAILMARSVLEASAKDKGITEGTLAHKIGQLAERDIVSPQIRDEAHEIRYLGNDMAHGDFTAPVTEDDAEDILGFLDTFLDYVYQMPADIRHRQEKREIRARNPNA